MRCFRFLPAVAAIGLLLNPAPLPALINPHFTPVHLVKESKLILVLDFKAGANKDQYTASILQVLKGKTELKALRLDLAKAINVQNADALRELAAAGKPALFFTGEFGGADDKGAPSDAPAALLHLGGQWAELDSGPNGGWALRRFEAKWQGIWAGGTDMLRRAVDYIQEDEDAEVPVADGASWTDQKKIAAFEGKIRALRPIDLAGDGKLALFVARDQGDRLLVCDPKTRNFSDLTAARGLASKSQAFAWGDFDGDGRLDLISFDGKALSLHAQQADGTFHARPLDLGAALENGCVGLCALDVGTKEVSGLLLTTRALPVLIKFASGGKVSSAPLAAPGLDLKKLGQPGSCLVADLGGDGWADILAPFAAGSVLFRGQGQGQFAPGTACAIQLGRGETAACVADFDADGRLDVFTASADTTRIWQNEGECKFSETLGLSGEIAYISKPGGIDCAIGDVNNDGRQDVLIAYGKMSPLIFFNRGFRSFGHAHTLDLAERQLLAVAEQGQQSGCLADLDSDGAQDMVVALSGGELWVFFRENEDHSARSVTAVLPISASTKGPATVTGWSGKRCLGAWNLLPGTERAFLGRREAGPLTLKWRLPGGQPQQKEIIVEKETMRFEIK